MKCKHEWIYRDLNKKDFRLCIKCLHAENRLGGYTEKGEYKSIWFEF